MKKDISKTYLYLIMVLLLGLLLASFIKPLMEGFKEGLSCSGAMPLLYKESNAPSTSGYKMSRDRFFKCPENKTPFSISGNVDKIDLVLCANPLEGYSGNLKPLEGGKKGKYCT